MRILFTKKIEEELISQYLGNQFSYDYASVITIENKKVTSFSLSGKSLVFSSANAVRSFFENKFCPNENFTQRSCFNKIYAVGLKTKAELRKHGFGTFKVTKKASELAEFIIEHCSSEQFLHFCGNLSIDVLNRSASLQNIYYKKIVVYETKLLFPKIEEKYDAVVFFSPSGVRSFAKFNSFEDVKIFSMGETTEKELKKFTNQHIFTSKENNATDLLRLISEMS